MRKGVLFGAGVLYAMCWLYFIEMLVRSTVRVEPFLVVFAAVFMVFHVFLFAPGWLAALVSNHHNR